MVAISHGLATQVRLFLEAGDKSFLSTLAEMDRNNIEGQAVVRYLMQKKHWPFTPESEFSSALTHLFGHYPDRPARDPQEYRDTTFALIKETFDYECIVVVPEPKAETEEKPAKKPAARKPARAANRSSASHSDDHEEVASTDIDTTGASDRLKRVIGIQRGS